jgi:TolB protein
MVHKNDGKYGIAVMELETGALHVLTKGSLDESPSFAPNGSMLIYATSAGDRGALAWVSLNGRVPKTLAPGDVEVREPSWSPFNKK